MADQRMKQDGGKPTRPELLDVNWLLDVSAVLKFGAEKYAPNLWREGMDWSRCYGALLRHLFAFWSGEEFDPETDLPHLAHASCCLMFLSAYARNDAGRIQHDDRP